MKMPCLLKDTFYRPDERLVHWLTVQPEHVDPVVDVIEFACLTMTPAREQVIE